MAELEPPPFTAPEESGDPVALAEIRRWFGLVVVLAALHMTEQLLFGLDELQMIRGVLSKWYARFANPDFATVLLVTIAVVFVLLLIYGVLLGGRPLLWVMRFFAFVSISEVHHVIETIVRRRYVPGVVTAIVWVWVGVMLARATWRPGSAAAG